MAQAASRSDALAMRKARNAVLPNRKRCGIYRDGEHGVGQLRHMCILLRRGSRCGPWHLLHKLGHPVELG